MAIVILEDGTELWNADEDCDHELIYPSGGGVKCIKCEGWFCY